MEKVLIFGRGKYCRHKIDSIAKQYKVVGFLDNAVSDRTQDSEFGYPVYNPKYIGNLEMCAVICMSGSYVEMWRQLRELGVANDKILFVNHMKPFFSVTEEILFGQGQKLVAGKDKITYVLADGRGYEFDNREEFNELLRNNMKAEREEISSIASMKTIPVSRYFGMERGKAVDRYYIEKFLERNSDDIKGKVMEIADDTYTRKYGQDRVTESIVLHAAGWGRNSIKGNFETGEGITDHMADCLICTQTLQYIYDLKAAMKNIYRLLKPNGVALITVPGIKSLCLPDEKNWGERWSFTKESMRQLCLEVCKEDDFVIEAFGNVKIVTAYLYGICCEELSKEDFEYNDAQFPFLIAARLMKGGKE